MLQFCWNQTNQSAKFLINSAIFAVTPRVGVWIEIVSKLRMFMPPNVTPRVGVWIEIDFIFPRRLVRQVTPRVGVWIEIIKRI